MDAPQVLLASKAGVERSLVDLDTLKIQLEEVAKLIANESTNNSTSSTNPSPVSVTVVQLPSIEAVNVVSIELDKISPNTPTISTAISADSGKNSTVPVSALLSALKEGANPLVKTNSVPAAITPVSMNSSKSDQTKSVSTIQPPVNKTLIATAIEPLVDLISTAATTASTETKAATNTVIKIISKEIFTLPDSTQILVQSENLLRKLLKVLHVCSRYQQSTGKPLPSSIDFFGKTLLGMTSIRWQGKMLYIYIFLLSFLLTSFLVIVTLALFDILRSII